MRASIDKLTLPEGEAPTDFDSAPRTSGSSAVAAHPSSEQFLDSPSRDSTSFDSPPEAPLPAPPPRRQVAPDRSDDLLVAPKAVVSCYGFFDYVFSEVGVVDLTEGIYHGDPATPYETAQRNQIDYLLDQVGCGPGSRILDIGCGYGTLVKRAMERGAEAIGITISAEQVKRCRRQGLDVRLMNYRHLPDDWSGCFDGIVANGSLEHFVQPGDLALGLADPLYQEFFAVCHRLLDPKSPSRRLATTAIHLGTGAPRMSAAELRQSPYSFGWGTPKFHYALLQRAFGGSYPERGQLARAADPCFKLVAEVDGTQDYDWTSDEWFRRIYATLRTWNRGPRMVGRMLRYLLAHPRHGTAMLLCLFVARSWSWQFRGDDPPMRLLRQTWQWQPSSKCGSASERLPRKPR